MVAGYCWHWSKTPLPDGTLARDVEIGDYRRPWNARPEAIRLASGIPKAPLWARDPDASTWLGHRDLSHDSPVKRSGDRFVDLVKNTYRVLLTRGLRGCFVSFLDRDTERFFRSRMA